MTDLSPPEHSAAGQSQVQLVKCKILGAGGDSDHDN